MTMSIAQKEKRCQEMWNGTFPIRKDWLIRQVFSNHLNWEEKVFQV
jgi:hypothetical protein